MPPNGGITQSSVAKKSRNGSRRRRVVNSERRFKSTVEQRFPTYGPRFRKGAGWKASRGRGIGGRHGPPPFRPPRLDPDGWRRPLHPRLGVRAGRNPGRDRRSPCSRPGGRRSSGTPPGGGQGAVSAAAGRATGRPPPPGTASPLRGEGAPSRAGAARGRPAQLLHLQRHAAAEPHGRDGLALGRAAPAELTGRDLLASPPRQVHHPREARFRPEGEVRARGVPGQGRHAAAAGRRDRHDLPRCNFGQ